MVADAARLGRDGRFAGLSDLDGSAAAAALTPPGYTGERCDLDAAVAVLHRTWHHHQHTRRAA